VQTFHSSHDFKEAIPLPLDRAKAVALCAGGGAVVGGAVGGATGLSIGSTAGLVVGVVFAPITLGFSVPVAVAVGGGTGLSVGATAGGSAGLVAGGTVAYAFAGDKDVTSDTHWK